MTSSRCSICRTSCRPATRAARCCTCSSAKRITDPASAAEASSARSARRYHLPYFTLTPTFSVCPNHGYLRRRDQRACPDCGAVTEVYSRVVGYLRPVNQWNEGKVEEFKQRKTFRIGQGAERRVAEERGVPQTT